MKANKKEMQQMFFHGVIFLIKKFKQGGIILIKENTYKFKRIIGCLDSGVFIKRDAVRFDL